MLQIITMTSMSTKYPKDAMKRSRSLTCISKLFSVANTRQHLWKLVQLGPFAMEDILHGVCIYTATAFGKGSVICGNRFAIKCYDLAAGNTSQTKRSFVIELGRLLIICSTSI